MALQLRRGHTSGLGKMIATSFAILAFVLQPLVALNIPSAFAASGVEDVTTQQQLIDALADTSVNKINLYLSQPTTQQIVVNRSVEFNGGSLVGGWNATGGGNDAVLLIEGASTVFEATSLTVDGGGSSRGLQAIQVYGGAHATFNDLTVKNSKKAGLHVNGSTVSVNNLTTSANGANYGGVMLSGASTKFTVTGQSQQAEPQWDIYRDLTGGGLSSQFVDANRQYDSVSVPHLGITYAYTVKSAPAAPAFTVPTPTEGATLHNNGDVTVSWTKPSYAHSFNYSVDGGAPVNTQSQSVDLSLTSGTHTVKVQSQARSGLTGAWSQERTFTVDLLPTVTVDTPSADSYVSTNNYNQLTIKGSFTDDHKANHVGFQLVNSGGHSVALGTLYGYGSVNNPAATYAAADGSYTFNLKVPAHLPDGVYHLFYTGSDFTGGVTSRMERTFFIDNTNPTLTVTAPAASSDWQYINKANGSGTLHVTGSVDSSDSGTKQFGVSVGTYVSTGNNFGSWVTNCNNLQKTGTADVFDFSCDINLASISDNGKYVIRTTVQDNAGNWSAVNRYITVDKDQPNMTDYSATVNGVTYSLNAKNTNLVVKSGDSVTVTVNASDDYSSIDFVNLRAYENNTAAGNWHTYLFKDQAMTDNGNGTYSYTFTVPSEYTPDPDDTDHTINQGQYMNALDFNAKDAAGNPRGHEAYFTIDNTVPKITRWKVNGTDYANPYMLVDGQVFNSKDINAQFKDNSKLAKVVINNHEIVGKWSNPKSFDAEWYIKHYIVEGSNTIVLYDGAGNTTKYKFVIDTVAPKAPTNIGIWQNSDDVTNKSINDPNVVVKWTAPSDNDVAYYVYQAASDNGTYTKSNPWHTTVNGTSRPGKIGGEGMHYYRVQAVDNAGNHGAWSDWATVTLDTAAPDAPQNLTMSDTSGTLLTNGGTTSDESGTLSWDGVSDAVSYNLYAWDDTTGTILPLTQPTTPTVSGLPTTTIPTLLNDGKGTYHVCLTAVDAAGNESACSTTFTIKYVTLPSGNTGTGNTGDTNTGNGNTGDTNTGNGNTGDANTGAGNGDGNGGAAADADGEDVLGDQNTNGDDTNGSTAGDDSGKAVEGVSDTKDQSNGVWSLLGFAWYWWLLLLAVIAAIWWLIAARRRRAEEQA